MVKMRDVDIHLDSEGQAWISTGYKTLCLIGIFFWTLLSIQLDKMGPEAQKSVLYIENDEVSGYPVFWVRMLGLAAFDVNMRDVDIDFDFEV